MVICFLCKTEFTNFSAFKGHLSLFHNKPDYRTLTCVEKNCGRRFNLFNSFKRHVISQHNSEDPLNVCEQFASSIANEVSLVDSDIADVEPSTSVILTDDSANEQDKVQEILIDKAISLFIAGLYANDFLPRNVIQTIVDGFKNCVSGALLPAIKTNLEKLSLSGNIPPLLTQTIINSITPLMTDTWDKFSTEYKRLQYFEAHNFYIKPRSITIGQRLETVIEKGVKRLKPVTCEQAFISLRLVLTQFFSLKDVLLDTLKYIESLNNNMLLPNSAVENFIQGSYWKTVQQRNSDRIVMPLFLFYDDYEPGNVLGSRAGQHKLGAIYISIPCLPPCRSSVLTNIFLLLLFHSSDRACFGNNVIFQCVIEELNFLSEHGISIDIPDFKGKIYFELGLILGDNLGIHSMTGFLESFSANYPCRVCRVRKEVMKYQVEEDISLLRNTENYESDLLQNQPSETGIKEKCVWLSVKNFNLFDQVGVDSMHDILEGVAKYIMSFLITYFIRDAKFFTLEQLNYKLQGFNYGPDERNRPCSLSLDHLSQGNIRLSASEMLVLIRYFSLLVGEFIPTDNEYWSLYLKLRTVVELLSLTAFSKGTEELLQTNISELNSMYLSVCKDTLKPKFHNLLHYHTALHKFGPIISLWSMRFEAKHRISKIAARASCNKRNLTWTLAIKHQLKLNEMFLKGQLEPIIKTGLELSISSLETKYISDNLPISQMSKLVKVSWIKVSSTKYTKNIVLVDSYDCDSDLPVFFILREVYLYECDVILKGVLLKTLNFNEHLFSYEVNEPLVSKSVIKFHKDLLSPIPCAMNMVLNKRFVTLRSPI